ncbi:MAG: molybdate ABC transporter permease subunit [Chloroflexi bacterium]|nr:molybdate ABC transporter permease subunit [Chloroflexota bacterium]
MEVLPIIALTLQIALVATVIDVPFAIGLSWLIIKKRVPGSFVLDILASLPLAVPPVVVGYLLLILLGRNGPVGGIIQSLFGTDIVFTWLAAAMAASIVSFPLMARTIMVSMRGVDEGLERSARSLGASAWRVLFTITIPLAYRGILAGVLLGFVRAMSEFGATIVVAGNIPGRTQTLPLAIFSRVQLGDNEVALRLVAVSIGLAVITLALHNWLLERSQAGPEVT